MKAAMPGDWLAPLPATLSVLIRCPASHDRRVVAAAPWPAWSGMMQHGLSRR
jgi:hypothetical protein